MSSRIKDSSTRAPSSSAEEANLKIISAVNSAPTFGWFSLVAKLVTTAAWGSFLFGFNLALLNTSLATISADFKWCDVAGQIDCQSAKLMKAFVSTAVFIGAAVGSMSGGRFLVMGRRRLLLVTMAVFVVGVVSSCTAEGFASLLWARLLVGYGVGVISVVSPLLMSEVTPPSSRGIFGIFHQLFITIGIFAAVLLGLPVQTPEVAAVGEAPWETRLFDRVWWRVMLGFGILPVLLVVYLFMFVYKFETPHYYVEQNEHESARAILQKLNNKDDVDEELNGIVKAFEDGEVAKKNGLGLVNCFKDAEYRYAILVGMVLSGFQQLSGINVFVASSNLLFEGAGLETKLITILSTVLTFVNVIMTFPAMFLIERLGRKSMLIIGSAGMCISVLPGAIVLNLESVSETTASWVAVGGAIGFIVFFSSTYGPVLWVYLTEIYPTEIKGTALGLATATNWICGIIMVFVTAFIESKINYIIFTVMSGVAVFVAFFFMKETKGLTLEESPFFEEKRKLAV